MADSVTHQTFLQRTKTMSKVKTTTNPPVGAPLDDSVHQTLTGPDLASGPPHTTEQELVIDGQLPGIDPDMGPPPADPAKAKRPARRRSKSLQICARIERILDDLGSEDEEALEATMAWLEKTYFG